MHPLKWLLTILTGCGNGKYLSVACSGYTIGCDMCPELACIAGGRGHEVAVADCLNLPFRTNSFDAVISIAVVHHLSSGSRRLQALRELIRVTRKGGTILVYVWAMEQERKKVIFLTFLTTKDYIFYKPHFNKHALTMK